MNATRLLLPLVMALYSLSSSADMLRCGSVIIEEGDSRERVMEKCGEPDVDEGDLWYYKSKSAENVTTAVHFEADEVTYIEDEID